MPRMLCGVLLTTLCATAVSAQLHEEPRPANGSRPAAPANPVVIQEDAGIDQVAWSADGSKVATVGLVMDVVEFKDQDGRNTGEGGAFPNMTVKLWDAKTGMLLRSAGEEAHTNITAIAFSPDGRTAAIASLELLAKRSQDIRERPKMQLRLVDVRSWELKKRLEPPGFVTALAFSPDGSRLAYGGRRRLAEKTAFLEIWDIQNNRRMGGTEECGKRISRLAFSRDGQILATGDEDGKVQVVDGRTGESKWQMAGHSAAVCSLGLSADSTNLLIGGFQTGLQFWDVASGRQRPSPKESPRAVGVFATSPDGKRCATVGRQQDRPDIIVWDADTWEAKHTLAGPFEAVCALAFSPDGTTLAIGTGKQTILGPGTGNGRQKTTGTLQLWKLN